MRFFVLYFVSVASVGYEMKMKDYWNPKIL